MVAGGPSASLRVNSPVAEATGVPNWAECQPPSQVENPFGGQAGRACAAGMANGEGGGFGTVSPETPKGEGDGFGTVSPETPNGEGDGFGTVSPETPKGEGDGFGTVSPETPNGREIVSGL